MREAISPTGRIRRLAPRLDRHQASCGENGPSVGPIRLLIKTGANFAPRPVEELNRVFSFVAGRPVNCSGLVSRLGSVTRAMNAGERAQAIFATQYLQLPTLTEEEARRADRAEALLKAAPDDPQYPAWPKGTEGGLGGKFRPKDGAAPPSLVAAVIQGFFPANDNFCALTAAIPLTIDGTPHTNCYYNCANKQSFVTTWYGNTNCPALDTP